MFSEDRKCITEAKFLKILCRNVLAYDVELFLVLCYYYTHLVLLIVYLRFDAYDIILTGRVTSVFSYLGQDQ